MATYRKKGKVWVVNHCKDGKRWPQETFHSAEAARARRLQIEKDEELGVAISRSDSRTLADAARYFILERQKRRDRPGAKGGGAESYEQRLRYYILPRLGSMLVCDIKKKHVQQAINDLQDAGYKPRTVIGAYGSLNVLLNFAVDQEWLLRNPLRDGEKVELPTPAKVEIFTDDEFQAIIDAANTQAYSENLLTYLNRRAVVYLGAEAGLRPGESFGLQWESINFSRGKITVQHSNVRRVGFHGTKTGAINDVDLTAGIYAALSDLALYWTFYDKAHAQGWRSYHHKALSMRIKDMWAKRHEQPIDMPPRTGFIILSKNLRPLNAADAWPFWQGLLKKAGVDNTGGRASKHKLRHWNASYKLRNGVPVPLVAKEMRHADGGALLLRTYAHVMPTESSLEVMAPQYEQFKPRQLPPPGVNDNRHRKLTEDQVREIRARIADGEGEVSIAKDMGISRNMVQDIRSRRSWAWLA